jgi:hypothetical protein
MKNLKDTCYKINKIERIKDQNFYPRILLALTLYQIQQRIGL